MTESEVSSQSQVEKNEEKNTKINEEENDVSLLSNVLFFFWDISDEKV